MNYFNLVDEQETGLFLQKEELLKDGEAGGSSEDEVVEAGAGGDTGP